MTSEKNRGRRRQKVDRKSESLLTFPLAPIDKEPFSVTLPSGTAIQIQQVFQPFARGLPFRGPAAKYRKPPIDSNAMSVFAEIAVVRLLQRAGWDAVWVDSWRRAYRDSLPPQSCQLPTKAQRLLDRISGGRKWPTGCWDVLAWKNGKYFSIECKRKEQDRLNKNQKAWLGSAWRLRIPIRSFIIFEWDFE
jgi:hypothetical protein